MNEFLKISWALISKVPWHHRQLQTPSIETHTQTGGPCLFSSLILALGTMDASPRGRSHVYVSCWVVFSPWRRGLWGSSKFLHFPAFSLDEGEGIVDHQWVNSSLMGEFTTSQITQKTVNRGSDFHQWVQFQPQEASLLHIPEPQAEPWTRSWAVSSPTVAGSCWT